MDFRLDGKVALVTGGNSGIGRAIAHAFAANGATVAICGRDAERNAAVAAEVEGRAYEVDVGVDQEVIDLIGRVRDDFGGLDILVNNAGMARMRPVEQMDLDEWRRVLDVNLTSAVVASREFANSTETGKIINILSEYSSFGGALLASYTASKHALHGLTKTMAIEFAPRIQVNGIQPGWISTPMTAGIKQDPGGFEAEILQRTPSGRWGEPDDLGGAAVFLASSASDFVTGVMLPVDGGYRIR